MLDRLEREGEFAALQNQLEALSCSDPKTTARVALTPLFLGDVNRAELGLLRLYGHPGADA